MREILEISVRAVPGDPLKTKADVLAVGVFEGHAGALVKALDTALGGAVVQVRKLGDFQGKVKQTVLLYGQGRIAAERVLLVGLGPRKKVDMPAVQTAAATAAFKAVEVKAGTLAVAVHGELDGRAFEAERLGRVLAEAVHFGAYRYDEYVTPEGPSRPKRLRATLVEPDAARAKAMQAGVRIGQVFGEARNWARTIMNRPANVINPAALADEAKKLAAGHKHLRCTVWNLAQIRRRGMGGILAVGQGSGNEPRFIVLRYTPPGRSRGRIGLVGKAITFDSGGISIKPSANMHEMKFDKSGGTAVLGAMRAIAELKPDVEVLGIVPSAENMPGGTSYRPGDIVTTYSGKTVEIQNTDAEGRMLLCDAIHYAVEQGCDAIVDAATLTGACVVALGEGRAGLMGNNDAQIEQLRAAAEATGEKVWPMPSDDEYLEQMKSKIADLKNIGGKWGGACTAAAFLGAFAGKTDWAHVDMAGAGMVDGEKRGVAPGSIGYGVGLLAEYVCHQARPVRGGTRESAEGTGGVRTRSGGRERSSRAGKRSGGGTKGSTKGGTSKRGGRR